MVNTIGAVSTTTGLTAAAVLDAGRYPTGIKISDEQMRDLEDRALTRHGFHGEWNYTLLAAPDPQPEPPAPDPQPDLGAWNHPVLTGLDPAAAPARCRTPGDLRDYAVSHGITIPEPAPPA